MNCEYHQPVLYDKVLEALNITPEGIYVDATYGGGGHSEGIVHKLDKGHLYALDQDGDAKNNAGSLEKLNKGSFTFIKSNFRYVKKYLRFYGVMNVDGIFADLGVSSHQLNEAKRGFSIKENGILDMRMDKQENIKTARYIVNKYKEDELVHIFSQYGEVKNAKTLSKAVVDSRKHGSINTTEQLRNIVLEKAPKYREYKYLAQVFQSIRIEVNQELEALKEFLLESKKILKTGGKLVVISYHSLEDRMVKNFINKGNVEGRIEKDFYGNSIQTMYPENRKPIVPEKEEIQKNNRARSAKMRIGIKHENINLI